MDFFRILSPRMMTTRTRTERRGRKIRRTRTRRTTRRMRRRKEMRRKRRRMRRRNRKLKAESDFCSIFGYYFFSAISMCDNFT